jgi:hypothetical protein
MTVAIRGKSHKWLMLENGGVDGRQPMFRGADKAMGMGSGDLAGGEPAAETFRLSPSAM